MTSEIPNSPRIPNSLVTCPPSLIGNQNIQQVDLNGTSVKALIDTGSQVSFISNSLYEDH